MSVPNGPEIPPPSPELLAAYVDGEFEGSEELAGRKQAIEDWLETHPDAYADILAWRRLKRLVQCTAPAEPADEAWAALWARVQPALRRQHNRSAGLLRMPAWLRGVVAASALLMISAAGLLAWRASQGVAIYSTPVVEPVAERAGQTDTEVFPVATAEEIAILHVEGDDTGTVVVGRMPVDGPLELAQPGDVLLNSVSPAPGDEMVPDVQWNQGSPMIWAPVQRERPNR